jgi:hypothetical protein
MEMHNGLNWHGLDRRNRDTAGSMGSIGYGPYGLVVVMNREAEGWLRASKVGMTREQDAVGGRQEY